MAETSPTVPGTLPINDSRWFDYPLEARFSSIVASKAGLDVTIEPTIDRSDDYSLVWRGHEGAFRKSGYFNSPRPFPVRRRWCYPNNLRGHLERVGDDDFRFTIEWVYISTSSWGTFRRQSKQALKCPEYLKFRAKFLPSMGDAKASA